jgi:hypothetical protein
MLLIFASSREVSEPDTDSSKARRPIKAETITIRGEKLNDMTKIVD